MKANELRIGNYVNVPIPKQCPFRIDGFEWLSYEFIKVAQEVKINGKEVHPLTWYGDDLQPIPLTEEWLLKFGFKIEGDNGVECSWIIGKFRLCSDATVFIEDKNNIDVKYVHQLQNLYFVLTGEELTFKSE